MSTKLIIKQSQNTAEQVTSSLIDKLYQLASTEGALTNDSDLEGTISTGTTYEDAVTFLQTKFPNLTILASAYYIRFVDPNVLQTLLNAGIGDGIGVSTANAAVANIGTIFRNNSTITNFDEFKYFTVANTTGTFFDGCTNLESIDLSYCTKLDSNYFDGCRNLCYFHGRNSERGVLTVAEGTLVIGGQCFRSCQFLTNVIIPNSVTSIGSEAFYGCSLTSITIPDSVTRIGEEAFRSCSGLTSVIIPDGVTIIGKSAFMLCRGLTSIIIGSSVTSIGDLAFYGCSGLTSITITAATPPTISSIPFDDTNDCPIYVPAGSVSAYQTTGNWTTYASRIQAIPT